MANTYLLNGTVSPIRVIVNTGTDILLDALDIQTPNLKSTAKLGLFGFRRASFCPQSGQVSKPAATPPTSSVIACRSTDTSVRTVWPVPCPGFSEWKKLARPDSH